MRVCESPSKTAKWKNKQKPQNSTVTMYFKSLPQTKKMNLEKASGHTNDLILCFWIFMNGYNFVYAAKDQKKMLLKPVHLLYFIVDWSESLELILDESSAFA